MTLSVGSVLHNRYRIVQALTQGGFGAIYRVWDTSLARTCALKENLDTSAEAQRQFEREAKILADLSHANLPRVSDYFFLPGQGQYLVMDYIDGQDLQEMLEKQDTPLDESQSLVWILQVCSAISYLHAQQPPIIHRDIKPANIQITAEGQAMLVDFGIAKVFDPGLKTTIGAQAVTPGYSPIEQYGQEATDARSDIYALGATLYTILTGSEPVESVKRVVRDTLVPAEKLNPLISPSTATILRTAMRVDPQERYQNAFDFMTALERANTPRPNRSSPQPQALSKPSKTPWIWIGLIAVLLVFMVALAMWVRNAEPNESGNVVLPTYPSTRPTMMTTSPPAISAGKLTLDVPTVRATAQPILVPRVHIVQPGEYCTQIAQGYGISVNELITLNHTDVDCTIIAGQRLLIPSQEENIPIATTPHPTQVALLDGMTQVYVPAGVFWMGADEADRDASSDEFPGHWVYLEGFWIDRTEVTNAMYELCVRAGMCQLPREQSSKTRPQYFGNRTYADYPVIHVTWEDADLYCKWVGGRLPSEAEWEKAARTSDGRRFPWGEVEPDITRLNFNNQIGDCTAVGAFPEGASQFGALDMAGNVSEWVSDWFDESYYQTAPVDNPTGPPDGTFKGIRGGSWFSPSRSVRTSFRHWNLIDNGYDSTGFRCVRLP